MKEQIPPLLRPDFVTPVSLKDFAAHFGLDAPAKDAVLTGISMNTNDLRPGDLFVAMPGKKTHGAEFIQKALELGADVVVYNRTWASRINMSMHDNFEPSQGLKNFIYSNPHMPSTGSPHVGDSKAAIFSTVWQNLENSTFFDFTKEQLVAVDLYMKYFMNYNFQDTIDGWLFEFWHNKILDAGVLPVFFNNDNVGKVAYDFSGRNPNFDTPFHTDRATQQTVANNIHQIIHGQNIQRHQ